MKPKPKKVKPPKFAVNKRAFDETLRAFRDSHGNALGAMQYNDSSGVPRYEAKPTPTDFKCDVEKVISKCAKKWPGLKNFYLAYVVFDSDDTIEIEVHANRVIGEGRHGLEQGMGAEFIRRKLFPAQGKKGYFNAIRKWRGAK